MSQAVESGFDLTKRPKHLTYLDKLGVFFSVFVQFDMSLISFSFQVNTDFYIAQVFHLKKWY